MKTTDLNLRMDLASALHLAHRGDILAVRSNRRDGEEDYIVTGIDKDWLSPTFTGRLNLLMDEAFASGLVAYDRQLAIRLTASGKAFIVGFYGEIDNPGSKPVFEDLGAYGPNGWTSRETIEMRRDHLLPGNIVHSSHGVRFQIEAVLTSGEVTQIWNGRHGRADHTERYDSVLTIAVEVQSLYPQQRKTLATSSQL